MTDKDLNPMGDPIIDELIHLHDGEVWSHDLQSYVPADFAVYLELREENKDLVANDLPYGIVKEVEANFKKTGIISDADVVIDAGLEGSAALVHFAARPAHTQWVEHVGERSDTSDMFIFWKAIPDEEYYMKNEAAAYTAEQLTEAREWLLDQMVDANMFTNMAVAEGIDGDPSTGQMFWMLFGRFNRDFRHDAHHYQFSHTLWEDWAEKYSGVFRVDYWAHPKWQAAQDAKWLKENGVELDQDEINAITRDEQGLDQIDAESAE